MDLAAASVAVSALAVVLGVANIFYTQWRTDIRDVARWSNDQLLKLTSELLQLSASRQSELETWYATYELSRRSKNRQGSSVEKVWQMEVIVEQIRLLDDEIAEQAHALYVAHRDAEEALADANPNELDPMTGIETLMVSDLNQLHQKLIKAFRNVTGVSS